MGVGVWGGPRRVLPSVFSTVSPTLQEMLVGARCVRVSGGLASNLPNFWRGTFGGGARVALPTPTQKILVGARVCGGGRGGCYPHPTRNVGEGRGGGTKPTRPKTLVCVCGGGGGGGVTYTVPNTRWLGFGGVWWDGMGWAGQGWAGVHHCLPACLPADVVVHPHHLPAPCQTCGELN